MITLKSFACGVSDIDKDTVKNFNMIVNSVVEIFLRQNSIQKEIIIIIIIIRFVQNTIGDMLLCSISPN